MSLTAAQLGSASLRLGALDGFSVLHREAGWAGVVRAVCLAARSGGAPGVGAHLSGGALDLGKPVGARVGQAELFAALSGGARSTLAHGGVGGGDGGEVVRARYGVAGELLRRAAYTQEAVRGGWVGGWVFHIISASNFFNASSGAVSLQCEGLHALGNNYQCLTSVSYTGEKNIRRHRRRVYLNSNVCFELSLKHLSTVVQHGAVSPTYAGHTIQGLELNEPWMGGCAVTNKVIGSAAAPRRRTVEKRTFRRHGRPLFVPSRRYF